MNRIGPMRMATAMAVLASLGNFPEHADVAAKMSPRDALKVHDRWQRRLWSSGSAMSPAQLVALSTKRRRARITHPGKRR